MKLPFLHHAAVPFPAMKNGSTTQAAQLGEEEIVRDWPWERRIGKSIGGPGSSPCMPAASCTRATLSFADSETAAGGDMLAVADTTVGPAGRLGFSEIAAASAAGVSAAPSRVRIGEPEDSH